jgi:hypothetical protein
LLAGLAGLGCGASGDGGGRAELVYEVGQRLRVVDANNPDSWRDVPSPWDAEDSSARQERARWSPSGVLVYEGGSREARSWGLVLSDGTNATLHSSGDCHWGAFAEHTMVGQLAIVRSEGVVQIGSNGEDVRCTYAHDVDTEERLASARGWSSSDGKSLIARCPGPSGSADIYDLRTEEVLWERDISLGCPRLLENGPWMLDGSDAGNQTLRDPRGVSSDVELPMGMLASGDFLAPDGKTLLLQASNGQLEPFELRAGTLDARVGSEFEWFAEPHDWSTDSTQVLVAESCSEAELQLSVLSVGRGLAEVYSTPCAAYQQFELSPDGTAIATTLLSDERSVVRIVRAAAATDLGPGVDAHWRPAPSE